MKVIYKCKNGDTDVILFDDGTREMDNHLENEPFHLEWPVSIDLNISNYCERGCPFCYQNCTKQGKSTDLNVIKKNYYILIWRLQLTSIWVIILMKTL